MNSMFELATLDEIDKLRNTNTDSGGKSSEELELDDLEDLDKTLHIKGQVQNRSYRYWVFFFTVHTCNP